MDTVDNRLRQGRTLRRGAHFQPRWYSARRQLRNVLDNGPYKLIILCILISAGFTIHYFRVTDRSILLLVDDTLANVSVTLSKFGRHGLMPMPLQDLQGAVRTHGFYNYGPAPFVLGAALDWLFGTSYLIQRTIHPLVLIGLSFLAVAVFRRASIAAGGLFAALVIWIFWRTHVPMFRPDITVSLFAGFGMAALTWAIRTNSLLGWGSAAFCITTAVTTHQIAVPLVPSMGVVWVLAQWLNSIDQTDRRAFRKQRMQTFSACIAGGLLGLLIYAIAIEFRFQDLFRMWQEYLVVTAEKKAGWWTVYRTHFSQQWSSLDFGTALAIAAAFGASLALLAASPMLRPDIRRCCLAFLLPGIALGLAYQAWLGFYHNYATGYTYLAQITVFWTIAAGLASLMAMLRAWKLRLARTIDGLSSAGIAVILVWVAANPAEQLFTAAKNYVSGAEYLENIFQNLPQGSVAWGDPFLGLDTPARVNFVNISEALFYAGMWKPEQREAVAPGFLVLGSWLNYATWDAVQASGRSIDSSLYGRMTGLFPDLRYELKSIVYGPPYGMTRVYGLSDAPSSAKPPLVAMNRGGDSEWRRWVGAPIPFTAETVLPVAFDLTLFDQRATGVARRSSAVILPPGDYLLEARVSNDSQGGALIASDAPYVKLSGGLVPFAIGMAPYFSYEQTVHILFAHNGGKLYVSQFSSTPASSFEIVQIQPVISLLKGRFPQEPLPTLDTWNVVAKNGSAVNINGELEVVGDDSSVGYQLVSPPIPVKPHSVISVNLPVSTSRGSVGLGVLNNTTTEWLAHRTGGGELSFNTGDNHQIFLVVNNANPGGAIPMTFRVRPGTFERWLSARPLPAPDTWQIVAEGGSAMQPNGELEAVGEAYLASPAIDVEPNSTVIVDLPVWAIEGSVGFGALDEAHQWLAHRSGGGEIKFNAGNNKRISLLVQNTGSEVQPRKRFHIKSGSILLQEPLPTLDTWNVVAKNGSAVNINGELEVVGDDSSGGYQLVSPPIPVKPHSVISVNLPVSAPRGSVGLGVLNKTGTEWLAHRTGGGEISFNTGDNQQIVLVVDNANPGVAVPMTFRVRPGTLERRLSARPMPPPDSWQIVPEGGSATQPNGGLEVVGEAHPASPAIDVEPNSTVIVDLPLSVSEGSVSFGALDETHQWLAQRSGGGEIRFNTGNNRRFSLLVQSASSEAGPRKRFRVKSGSIWLKAGIPYVDKLTLCREWADKGREKPVVCN